MPRKQKRPAARKAAAKRNALIAQREAEKHLPWHEQRRRAALRAGTMPASTPGTTMGLAMAVLGAQAMGSLATRHPHS